MNNAGMKKGIKLMNTNEKLREALEGLMPIVRIYLKKNPAPEIMTWDKNDVLPSGRIPDDKVVLINPKQAYAKAEAALALPRRNCDVGTAEEQDERFRVFCGDQGAYCTTCPCDKPPAASCRLLWAQMPYEEVKE